MKSIDPILEFEAATLPADGWHSACLDNFSLALRPGELALIHFDSRAGHGPLADAAMGLLDPDAGKVKFQGDDWQDQRAAVAGRRRGQIGRYFGKRGWVYHLDLDENVTLRERHHSHRPIADIEDEADRLAKSMGLERGLPTERPGRVDPIDLQRSACVRMLLGRPPLVVLDEPSSCLIAAIHDPLMREIRSLRDHGSAVLWMTADPTIWENTALEPTVKIDQTGRHSAVARLATAFDVAMLATGGLSEVPTAAGPQARR